MTVWERYMKDREELRKRQKEVDKFEQELINRLEEGQKNCKHDQPWKGTFMYSECTLCGITDL